MKNLRPAFTLIEILVSVLILSVSIVAVFQIHSRNHARIVYITERNKHALEDSLFLDKEAMRYHKEARSAYDILQKEIRPTKSESREILKKIKRTIYIPEPVSLTPDEENGPAAEIEEIKLKGAFSSSYFHFKINTL